ncbi:molybdate transport system permease protein [Rubritalea squalenifaciens DSM 18772]|uniref:Molybdate transport system permease protein n=1 Tax=Rubritalea squalenifaciens DSM 18772 TaxID=1123071 RepID=A0A1M6MBA7_9BACT|nr:ABC transporter permease [Rubritalea squalenifaciens]SHJ80778.1 molybdate transport system permease protein [Rubritalea squalenifaciens DSM 18772]
MKHLKPTRSDLPFYGSISLIGGAYVALLTLLVLACASFLTWETFTETLQSPAILQSLKLTFLTCTASSILALFVSVPLSYSLSRFRFRGRSVIDTLLDIPIVLPPIVVGLSLLILFNSLPSSENSLERLLNGQGTAVTFHVPAIILAQFTIITAFATRSLKVTFDQLPERTEHIALTLGCNRFQAFWKICLPQAQPGILAAGLLAWARALGEFGPILIFAGATRGKTEVLSTSIFLEINTGNLPGAAAISLVLILLSLSTISLLRFLGSRTSNN